jgi:hypothetical protein
MKMIEVKSYRDLTVWQKSMDLVVNRKTKSKEKIVNFFDF